MIPLIENIFFDSKTLQSYLFHKDVTVADLTRRLSIMKRRDEFTIPDHQVFGEKSFLTDLYDSLSKLLYKYPYDIARELLSVHECKLYVRSGKFEDWIRLTSKISPTFFIAGWYLDEYERSNLKSGNFKQFVRQHLLCQFQYSALLSPHIPELESFVHEESGLMDLHLHLNGTTESESIWSNALQKPYDVISEYEDAYKKDTTKKQFEQIMPELDLEIFKECLQLSGQYRQTLISEIGSRIYGANKNIDQLDYLWGGNPDNHLYGDIVNEIIFNILVMSTLRSSSNEHIAKLYHFYLITKGLFCALSVQQSNQFGFDQFQYISDNGIRENIEKRYEQRFFQLVGYPNHKFTMKIEGRFSPKETVRDNRMFVDRLVSDFEAFKAKCTNSRFDISLVAHFIKRNYKDEDKDEIRNRRLRVNLRKRAMALLQYKMGAHKNSKYITGVDAAANELNVPPEVFAPIFKYLRNSNLFHFTYHVGEDFRHLLSGIRAIDEAIEFLEMQQGDRLGHCTAIGIGPSLWIERSARTAYITRGEWLDNLVWISFLISSEKDFLAYQYLLPKIQTDISRYSTEIFGHSFSMYELRRFWELRKYDPLVYYYDKGFYGSSSSDSYTEWKEIRKKFKEKNIRLLYEHYHSNKSSRKRYDEYISIEANYFDSDMYKAIQNWMLKKIIAKGLVIETLPSSNFRISQYVNFDEYHLERWTDEHCDYNPLVVLGTDDPGIFNTNIYNEYARIYMYWKRRNYSTGAIMNKIREIHNTSKIYTFYARERII